MYRMADGERRAFMVSTSMALKAMMYFSAVWRWHVGGALVLVVLIAAVWFSSPAVGCDLLIFRANLTRIWGKRRKRGVTFWEFIPCRRRRGEYSFGMDKVAFGSRRERSRKVGRAILSRKGKMPSSAELVGEVASR